MSEHVNEHFVIGMGLWQFSVQLTILLTDTNNCSEVISSVKLVATQINKHWIYL